MRNEILAAVEWLTNTIEVSDLDPSQLERFRWALIEALTRKYTDHWYQDMPWRGQGYRSILSEDCAHVVDHVLRHATREAGITDLPSRMPTEAFIIWVDPGDVEVKFLKSQRTELLYHQPSNYNPYAMGMDSMSSTPSLHHRRSVAATPSNASTSPPQRHHNINSGFVSSNRMLSIEEVDVDGASSLLLPEDEMGVHFKNNRAGLHLRQQHDTVRYGGGYASPPQSDFVSPHSPVKSSKFNLHARPWPVSGGASWTASAKSFNHLQPLTTAGMM